MPSPDPMTVANKAASFLPSDYIQEKVELRSNATNLLLFIVVMAGVAGAFLVTQRQWSQVKDEQKLINAQYQAEAEKIDQLTKLESQRAEMIEKAEMTALLLEKVPRSALMAELVNRLPGQATLQEVALKSRRIVDAPSKDKDKKPAQPQSLSASGKSGGTPGSGDKPAETKAPIVRPPRMEYSLLLTGLAASDADVADYQKLLKDSPLLERVDLISSLSVKVEDSPLRKFRIEAQLKPNADVRSFQPMASRRPSNAPRISTHANGYDPAQFMQVQERAR